MYRVIRLVTRRYVARARTRTRTDAQKTASYRERERCIAGAGHTVNERADELAHLRENVIRTTAVQRGWRHRFFFFFSPVTSHENDFSINACRNRGGVLRRFDGGGTIVTRGRVSVSANCRKRTATEKSTPSAPRYTVRQYVVCTRIRVVVVLHGGEVEIAKPAVQPFHAYELPETTSRLHGRQRRCRRVIVILRTPRPRN